MVPRRVAQDGFCDQLDRQSAPQGLRLQGQPEVPSQEIFRCLLHLIEGVEQVKLIAATKFYVNGMTEREIAEIMAWEENSVSRIIRRYVGRSAAIKDLIRRLNQNQ